MVLEQEGGSGGEQLVQVRLKEIHESMGSGRGRKGEGEGERKEC